MDRRVDRRKAQTGEGAGLRLLAIAYLFWALSLTMVRIGGACAVEPLCRVGGSGQLSVLIMSAPLAVIIGSLTTRRRDEGIRLLAIGVAAAALIMAPTMLGDIIAALWSRFD